MKEVEKWKGESKSVCGNSRKSVTRCVKKVRARERKKENQEWGPENKEKRQRLETREEVREGK